MIFFDPQGDGCTPLNLYRKLAEDHHTILVSSNNSRNGIETALVLSIANHLITEIYSRFPVNHHQVALCGFSGGAKVALLSAQQHPEIPVVIYCGAVIPVRLATNTRLLGFAGLRDMNYTDLVGFQKNDPARNLLIQWNGKHEFPNAAVFKDAFYFMGHGTIPDYERKKPTVPAQEIIKEQEAKQLLIDAFGSKDLKWWQHEVQRLRNSKKDALMNERLLGYISLACYSLINRAIAANDLKTAHRILDIYKTADPGNKACKEFETTLRQKPLR